MDTNEEEEAKPDAGVAMDAKADAAEGNRAEDEIAAETEAQLEDPNAAAAADELDDGTDDSSDGSNDEGKKVGNEHDSTEAATQDGHNDGAETAADGAVAEAAEATEATDATETAEAAEAPEAEGPRSSVTPEPPATGLRSPSTSSEESSDDDDEAADEAGELRLAKTKNTDDDDDDDDTKSDASEPTRDDEEDEPDDGQMSPTSEMARERRLRTRLTSFDKRQEKFSLMKATVKTFDVSMEVVIGKWKRLREDFIKLRANSLLASDGDDGSLMITRRMTEIGNMCSRTTNAAFYVATLPETIKIAVQKMNAMPRDVFTETRRRGWSQYDRFVYAARMARVLAQACLVRRRLTIETLGNGKSMSEKDLVTNSMSKNLRDCMSFCPEYRTKEMRQKILWFLRTNKVYTHLFSSEMEEECTKFVFYEKYQDGRILSLTDRVPEKFYYVISGKIERRKTYELRAGDYDRVFSVITKGQTSDLEQMELQRPRKFTLVASGVTEVLTLERDDFFQLLKGTGGLPLNFLRGIGIFQEFPCHKFLTSPEAILTRYFPKDRVILEDITDTQWIHVVKSGTAKVIRKQMVFHYARNKYSHKRSIGYAKPPSHSGAMQGLTERQRRYKAELETTNPLMERLPALQLPRRGGVNPLSHTIGIVQQEQKQQQSREAEAPLRLPKVPAAAAVGGVETVATSVEAKSRRARPLNMVARELQIPLRSAGSVRGGAAAAPRPLSQQRTAAAARVLLGPAGFPVDRPQREAYVVLDTLRSGDFLGFRNITALIEGERIVRDKDNVHTLLSEGAEIILISKRFFVQNAANNTMLKAETMAREFASKEEASLSIDSKEDWEMFKAAFVQRMVGHNREVKEAKKERQLGAA